MLGVITHVEQCGEVLLGNLAGDVFVLLQQVEQLTAFVATAAASLRDVGEATERVVAVARLTDGEVGELFDLSLAGAFR